MSVAETARGSSGRALFANFAAFASGLGRWSTALALFGFGALGALALAPFHIWPAAMVGLTFFVWSLDGAAKKKRKIASAFWRGWWFGFGYFLAGLWWIGSAFLVEADKYAALMPFAITLMPMGLALFWGLGASLAMWLWRSDSRRIAVLASAMFFAEYLRGHVLTGFSWNIAGQVWAAGGVISQSVAFFGVWGLTLVTLYAFMAPAALGGPDVKPARRVAPLIFSIAMFAVLFGIGFGRLNSAVTESDGTVRLRIVQAQIDQREKWRPENRNAVRDHYLRLTASPGLDTRTHVIWPESALPVLLLEEPRMLDAVARTVGEGRVLMTGSVRRDVSDPLRPRYFNSFVAISVERGIPNIAAVYDKVKLVPFGEFTPFASQLRGIIPPEVLEFSDGYTHGLAAATVEIPGAPNVAPQICYEVIYPGFTPGGADRPGWIVNVTNDAWYTGTPGPHQLFNQARFRAIEEGLPLARSAAGGVSAMVDAYGQIVAQLAIDADDVVDVDLPPALRSTLYSLVGDAVVFVMLAVGLFFGLRRRSPSRRRTR